MMIKKLLFTFAFLLFTQLVNAQPSNTNLSNGVTFDGEPFLAVNPINNQNLVAAWMGLKLSNGQLRIAIKTRASFDGGDSWSAVNTLPHFGTGYGSADVSMAFNKNGLLFLSYIDSKQSPDSGGVYVARSFDGGLNWDTPTKAFDMYDDLTKRAIDRPWLVVDNSNTTNSGTLYITTKPASWISPPNRNYFKASSDNGFTWTSIANIDGGTYLVGSFIAEPMATPATTVNGNFCAIYPSYVTTQNPLPTFYFAKSNDKGQSFNYSTVFSVVPAASDTNYKNGYQLISQLTDSNKFIFLTPSAQNGDADITAFHSNDGGQTWSGPIRVNDDTLSNGKGQDLVCGATNEVGNLVVTWRDRRNSPVNGFWNAGYDFYYATSTDNGQTFSSNQKLSSQFIAFDSVLTQNGNDFMSCVYRGDTLYSVWGDTRSGKMNIYFAKTIVSTNTGVGITTFDGEAQQWTIFPNPVANEINISVSEEMMGKRLSVYHENGKLILERKVTDRLMKIETKNLSGGNYFIKIENEVKRFVH